MSQGDLFGAAPKRVPCTVMGDAVRFDLTTSGAVYVGCALGTGFPVGMDGKARGVFKGDPQKALDYVRKTSETLRVFTSLGAGSDTTVDVHPNDVAHVRLNGTDG